MLPPWPIGMNQSADRASREATEVALSADVAGGRE
jgi:hypothetical protein